MEVVPNEDLDQATKDTVQMFWEKYQDRWKDLVLEGLITGMIVEEPMQNEQNMADIELSYIKSERVKDVVIENGNIKKVYIQGVIVQDGQGYGPSGSSEEEEIGNATTFIPCLLYTSPSPRD